MNEGIHLDLDTWILLFLITLNKPFVPPIKYILFIVLSKSVWTAANLLLLLLLHYYYTIL